MPIERVDPDDTETGLTADSSHGISSTNSVSAQNTAASVESEATHLKLTAQYLEDLEKIQAELDSLASLGKRSESPVETPNRAVCAKVVATSTAMTSVPVTLTSSTMATSSTGESVPVTLVNMGSGVLTKGGKSVLLVQKPVTPGVTQVKGATGSKITTVTPVLAAKPLQTASSGTTTITVPTLKTEKGDLKVILPGSSGEMISIMPGKRIITPASSSPIMNRLKVVGTQAPFSSGSTFTTTNSLQNATILSTDQAQAPTILLASPTKTFTVSRGNTTQVLRTIPGSPVRQGMVILSPVKNKVTQVPIAATLSKSPQKIAPAPNTSAGSKVSIVSATPSSTATTTTITTTSATTTTVVSGTSVLARSATALTASPQKIILRPIVPQVKSGGITPTVVTGQSLAAGQTLKQVVVPVSTVLSAGAGGQPVQVHSNKINYFRLVSAPQSTASPAIAGSLKPGTLVPVRSLTPAVTSAVTPALATVNTATNLPSNPVRITLPIAPAVSVSQPQQVIPKSTGQTAQQQSQPQRILIPSVRSEGTSAIGNATTLSQFPPNTLISANTPTGVQGFVMVSAQYLAQVRNVMASQSAGTAGPTRVVIQPQPANILPAPSVVTPISSQGFVPIAAAQPTTFEQQNAQQQQQQQQSSQQPTSTEQQQTQHSSKQVNGRAPVIEPPDSRIRKPCNCTKSQCLKLYCDCFANGEFCNNCNCNNCFNNLDHEEDRQRAIKSCLDRNPQAFHPKIGKGRDGDHERRHTKGCNCKRSGCLKNYCECYEAKILCTNLCKCVGCKNFEDSSERKTLMHLADAAEVRVQQQAAARTKISSQIQDLPTRPPIVSMSGERLPFSFVTQEVMEATCRCLLARAEDSERGGIPTTVVEKLVLEEFGRCLMQIIDCANRTKVAGNDH